MGLCLGLFGSEAKFLRLPTRHEEFFGGFFWFCVLTHVAQLSPRCHLHEVFGHGVFADEYGDGLTKCPIIEVVVVEAFSLAITSHTSVGRVAVDDAVARNLYLREVHVSDGQTLPLLLREVCGDAVQTAVISNIMGGVISHTSCLCRLSYSRGRLGTQQWFALGGLRWSARV